MKKAAMIATMTCLFLTSSAVTASASAEPTATKKAEHKMHVKEHKAKEHKLHAKELTNKEHKLHAKEYKAKEHKLRIKALPKTGNGGVSE